MKLSACGNISKTSAVKTNEKRIKVN